MSFFETLFPVRSSLRRIEKIMSELSTHVADLQAQVEREGASLSAAVAAARREIADLEAADNGVTAEDLAGLKAATDAIGGSADALSSFATELSANDPPVEPPPDTTPPEPPTDVVGEPGPPA